MRSDGVRVVVRGDGIKEINMMRSGKRGVDGGVRFHKKKANTNSLGVQDCATTKCGCRVSLRLMMEGQ